MGWDGYACRVQRDDFLKEDVLERLSTTDPATEAFWNAAASSEVEGLELFLMDGHLASRASARALAQGTGEEPYNTEWWPDQVKELAANADWDFPAEGDEVGHRESARLFLNVCAEHNLGVRFD